MKKLLLASVFAAAPLLGLAPAAVAQSAGPGWTGFYVGGSLGVARQRGRADNAEVQAWESEYGNDTRIGPNTSINGTLGIHAGYNMQVRNAVIGGEVDYMGILGQGANGSGSYIDSYATWNARMGARHAFSFRGRVGYDLGGAMIYATAGLGLVQVNNSADMNASYGSGTKGGTFRARSWQPAFVVGGGAEVPLSRNLSFRAQILHYMINDTRGTGTGAYFGGPGAPRVQYQDQSVTVAQFGLSYRF